MMLTLTVMTRFRSNSNSREVGWCSFRCSKGSFMLQGAMNVWETMYNSGFVQLLPQGELFAWLTMLCQTIVLVYQRCSSCDDHILSDFWKSLTNRQITITSSDKLTEDTLKHLRVDSWRTPEWMRLIREQGGTWWVISLQSDSILYAQSKHGLRVQVFENGNNSCHWRIRSECFG